ncbi:MAG: maleylacetate reductase [Paracoccaceae bacterium]
MTFQTEFALRIAPMRIRFGTPAATAVAEELATFGSRRALLISTASQDNNARAFAAAVGDNIVEVYAGAKMHTPVEVTANAVKFAISIGADCLVALGGGSAIGLSKALALHTDLPQIVVPTTYAGSEATAILGQTEAGKKTTITSPKVQPEVIIYDPTLVATLPIPLTVTSGLNAMAHAAEALYARDRNPLTATLAMQGLQAMLLGLPQVVEKPADLVARGRTQYGAFLCGTVLGQVGMSLHHKLCHTLGGGFDLPHAETHAVLLPHTVAYNNGAEGLDPLDEILGGPPGQMLRAFAKSLNAPLALRDLGMKESDLDRAADLATQNPYWNPRPVTREPLKALLQRAWIGDPPQ